MGGRGTGRLFDSQRSPFPTTDGSLTNNGGGDFGSLLRQYRAAAGLTQEHLAEASGLSVRGVSALETGERSRPQWGTVELLAQSLALSDTELRAFRAAARGAGPLDYGDDVAPPGDAARDGAGFIDNALKPPRQPPGAVLGRRGAVAAAAGAIVMGVLLLVSGALPSRSAVATRESRDSRTFAPAAFLKPMGVAVDSSGNMYVTDDRCPIDRLCSPGASDRVLRVSAAGMITASWDRRFLFVNPAGIARDSGGNLYVAEPFVNRVVKLSQRGKLLAGWGGAAGGGLKQPTRVAINSQNDILVSDTGNQRIVELAPSGRGLRTWGSEGQGPGRFEYPAGVAVDRAGNVYVADSGNNRVEKFSREGGFLMQIGGSGSHGRRLLSPLDLAVGTNGAIYVADSGRNRIRRFSATGRLLGSWGGFGRGPGKFNDPFAVTLDRGGNLYVVDAGNARIQKFTPRGRLLAQWGQQYRDVRLCVGAPGHIPGMKSPSVTIFNAVRMATSEWQARFAAAKLDLLAPVALEEAFQPRQEAVNAHACLGRGDTLGYIGPVSSKDALVSEPILNRAAMLTISPYNTMDALTDPKQRFRLEPATFARWLPSITYFRVTPTDGSQGPAAAVFMRRDLRLRTFFAADDGTSYGRMLATAMSAYGRHRLGLRLAGSAHLRLGDPASVHGLIAELAGVIAARNPGGVYCACDQTIAPDFARALRLTGYRGPLVSNDASFEGSPNWVGLKGRDFATAVDLPPETPALETFRHTYRARFHEAADPTGVAAYDAAAMALNAFYDAGSAGRLCGTIHAMRAAVLPYLADQRYRNGTQRLSFNANGDLKPRNVSIFALRHGQWRFLTSVQP
jgi:DNA-binding beta-propeller fold protein YncE/ABC-type branched-subunit amino acid transport system substrate-binding protein/transcriptional regulator with XRE-family HTH domain